MEERNRLKAWIAELLETYPEDANGRLIFAVSPGLIKAYLPVVDDPDHPAEVSRFTTSGIVFEVLIEARAAIEEES